MTATKSIEVLPYFQVETLPEEPEKQPVAYNLLRWGFALLGRLFPVPAARLAYRLFTTPRHRAVHRNSDEVLESARLFEVLYGKQILKCYEWGRGTKTVLLVHGWESRGTAMRSFVPGLTEAGFRVVAIDAPAHGNSGGKRTNLPHFAGAVRAVIKQTGGVYGIITHSFGGATAVFALSHLDNTIEIEKLVLIAVPASTQKVVADVIRRMKLPAKAVVHFRSMMREKIGGLPFDQTDVLNALENVKVQHVLVVHDKFDPSVSFESAEAIVERYDHASLLATQGWGHYRLMKSPDVVEKVTKFIAQDWL